MHRAGIQQEDVEPVVAQREAVGERGGLGERGEVGELGFDVREAVATMPTEAAS